MGLHGAPLVLRGDGQLPVSGLIQASNGSLYGTSYNGPYRIDPDGSNYAALHYMSGEYCYTLIQASDGYLYGESLGQLFKLDLTGADFSILRSLGGADGFSAGPLGGPLAEGLDGLLYGTAEVGGANGGGTIFRLDKSGGHFKVVHDFSGPDGTRPVSGLVRDASGMLYGTTSGGGVNGDGVIFRLNPAPWPFVIRLFPTAGPVFVQPGDPVQVIGGNFPPGAGVTIGGLDATNVGLVDDAHINANTPGGLLPGTLNDVVVTDPDTGAAGKLAGGWMADFLDVPLADPFHDFVEKIFRDGITAGMGGGLYGRDDPVTRAQMAVFLLVASQGKGYAPPACDPAMPVFSDVPCPSGFAVNFIEDLYHRGITAGYPDGTFGPNDPVTRAQMAVELLTTLHGMGYAPPNCDTANPVFADVACPSGFAVNFIEELYHAGITGGCEVGPPMRFCPDGLATRGQMAVFLDAAFALP